MQNGKKYSYIDGHVSLGLVLAILYTLVVLFLSSCSAEAAYGSIQKPLSIPDAGRSNRLGSGLERLSAINWLPSPSAFERTQPSFKYLFVWPHLPSVTEQQIHIAYQRLSDLVIRVEKEKAEQAKALQLQLDWEAFWKALALGLMAIGTIITIVLGIANRPRKTKG